MFAGTTGLILTKLGTKVVGTGWHCNTLDKFYQRVALRASTLLATLNNYKHC